ncbi:Dehydrogenase OXI1 [Lasiodiplodia hormozganensis]|uniref:Dehydrogenase OXI1 n=1 Tax=Lasiodiplodia hormozganensis TaxID=869390 RepID=A0AA39TQZ9_9PEZI|nr:Dehydrogenase OXI1 [Lasiodiplodia hormozganensis]
MGSTAAPTALTLAGKVAIVTGASRGIGAATALELAERGAKVVITYVSPSSEQATAALVSKINGLGNGAAAIAVRADLSNTESPAKIVSATQTAFGDAIDILVNNGAMTMVRALGSIAVADYATVFDLNVRSVILMTQAVLPHLRAPGRIVNISSVGSRQGVAGCSVYLASKGAVEALTRCWAAELGPKSHTVNAVAPGATDTEMLARGTETMDGLYKVDFSAATKAMTPMENRLGRTEEIAAVVAMLTEPKSQWVTGQTISVSGGLLMI